MDKTKALQKLLNGIASEEDVELLKRLLASGEISIGGNVNQSVIIIGSGNTVELPPAALDRLNARPMLGNLDRDLTGEEIASGLRRLDKLLPNRAPVLLPHYKEQVGRLRPTLKTEIKALSESSRRERLEALTAINSICVEAVDVSFNGLCLGEEAPKYDARSPFRGLESFRPEDSEFFFGREALTRKLVVQIQAHPFLAVLGASGSGKSSLVMAGLIPALASDYVVFRPGTNPLDELESARGKSLIVVDQFEELFTLTRDESTRKDFIARLLDESARARIILTLRSDFLGEVGAYRTLSAEIQNHLEIIPPMDKDELRHAMEGQASVVGLRFEADLSQQILDDVAGEPGAMPLLQHALWELWNRRHGRNLRASEYRAFGGVKQAITSTAEKVYADCSKPEQDQLRDIFLRLTRLDDSDEGRDTRRRVPLGDLIPSGRDAASITLLLDKLVNARLIVKTVNEGKTEIEVAHEALIRHWERLRLWLNEDRVNLKLREEIIDAARQWETRGREESLLLHHAGRLDSATSLIKNTRYGLTEIEQAYLNACIANKNRREHVRRQINTGLTFGFLLMLGIAVFAILQWQSSKRQQQISLAKQLVVQSQLASTEGQSNNYLATILALESMKINSSIEGYKALFNSINGKPGQLLNILYLPYTNSIVLSPNGKYIASAGGTTIIILDFITGDVIARFSQEEYIYSLVFSPDSKNIISSSSNTIRVWDVFSGKEIARKDEIVRVNVKISPDGKYILLFGQGTLRIFDFLLKQELAKLSYSSQVAFSSKTNKIAAVGLNNLIYIWDETFKSKTIHVPENGDITFLGFDPSEDWLVMGADNGVVSVWDIDLSKKITEYTFSNAVKYVSFSLDGKKYAVSLDNKEIRVLDMVAGSEVAFIAGTDNFIQSIFTRDGNKLIYVDADTIHVFDVTANKDIYQLDAGRVEYLALTPDGQKLVSYNSGGAKTWRVDGSPDLRHCGESNSRVVDLSKNGLWGFYNLRDKKIMGIYDFSNKKNIRGISTSSQDTTIVAVSSNGKYFAYGDYAGNVSVWDTTSTSPIAMFHIGGGIMGGIPFQELMFSPNSEYIFAIGSNSVGNLWNIESKEEILQLSDVNYIQFSEDSSLILTVKKGGEVNTWNIITGKEIADFSHKGVYFGLLNPTGKTILILNEDRSIEMWDLKSGNMDSVLNYGRPVSSVAFSTDGKKVSIGGQDGVVEIWDSDLKNQIASLEHFAPVKKTIFSSDDNWLAVVTFDGNSQIWSTREWSLVASITNMADDIVFSSDSHQIYAANYFCSTIAISTWQPDDIQQIACSQLPRNFTRSEWKQYIGDALPYQAVCPNLPIEAESTPTP